MLNAFALLVALVALPACYGQVAVQKGMTADSHCGTGYCFTALYDPSKSSINYTLVVPQGGQSGWWGVAQGTEMAGANMAINWVNADGTLTTSHRGALGHIEPTESDVELATFSRNTDVSKSSSSQTVWSWNMPVPTGAKMNAVDHIFAHSPTTPSSSATDAVIVKHKDHEHDFTIDLTKAYDGSAPKGLAGGSTSNSSTPSAPVFTGSGSSANSSSAGNKTSNSVASIHVGVQGDLSAQSLGGILIGQLALLAAGWLMMV